VSLHKRGKAFTAFPNTGISLNNLFSDLTQYSVTQFHPSDIDEKPLTLHLVNPNLTLPVGEMLISCSTSVLSIMLAKFRG